jgi:hypothetical protein
MHSCNHELALPLGPVKRRRQRVKSGEDGARVALVAGRDVNPNKRILCKLKHIVQHARGRTDAGQREHWQRHATRLHRRRTVQRATQAGPQQQICRVRGLAGGAWPAVVFQHGNFACAFHRNVGLAHLRGETNHKKEQREKEKLQHCEAHVCTPSGLPGMTAGA